MGKTQVQFLRLGTLDSLIEFKHITTFISLFKQTQKHMQEVNPKYLHQQV